MPKPRARSVKKEEKAGPSKKREPKQDVEEEDEDERPLAPSTAKQKPSNASKDWKEKRWKKEGPERPLAEEGEVKKIEKSENKKDKKGKKVYDLTGQKRDTPDERDPLRVFFETLYRQLPDNELAASWMMEWGLLPPDEAKTVYEQLQKSLQEKLESPVEAATLEKMSTCATKKRRKMMLETVLKAKKQKP